HGLTQAVVFDEHGVMEQPSTVFRKRAVLLHRCSLKRENPELERMLKGSVALLEAEGIKGEREPLRLLELCVPEKPAVPGAAEPSPKEAIDRVFRAGHASMLTRFPETYRVSMYIRRTSNDPIRFVLGLDAVVTVLRDSFYAGRLEGGLLEGLGRLLAPNVKLYIFPMRAEVLREQLR